MKIYILTVSFILSLFLTGCVFGPSPEEEISEVLDAIVEKEQGFVDSQEPIKTLEQDEKELFDNIMALSIEEFDEIEVLAEEALENLKQREEQIVIEAESIKEAKKEFEKINEYVGDIEDATLRSHVEEMIEVMYQRYDSHNELIVKYEEAIDLDRELYTMLKDEELVFEDLKEQVEKVNTQYDTTLELNDEFNLITDQYNQLKSDFYEMSGRDEEE
ncbi:YkyA family protein [Jeotgalibacillus marinus]|uniref:YkyA family protein n=1 Tax=Jeotgalibacillus marinus TaxID=86667 RepID=A0ABV3Q2B6_9BACL